MTNDVISRFQSDKLWQFHGGIHPAENKSQSNKLQIETLPLADIFYIPLKQHIGDTADLIVKIGDDVLKGKPLTQGKQLRELPIHAPTSGKIIAIEEHIANHPSGLTEPMIILQADGKDEWTKLTANDNYQQLSRQQLIDIIYQSGIAGLGGAVFPTANKIHGAHDNVKILIINAAECEPYITCDDRLMREYVNDIIEGCLILRHVTSPEEVVIAIEDNKNTAIKVLKKALKKIKEITLRIIPTIYPSGASKQLIQIITGIEVPKGQRSSSIGVLMQNIGTAYAVKRAVVNGEPLINRVVTITGNKIPTPRNYWIPFGTPIQHILNNVNYQKDKGFPIYIGGPLMGYILPNTLAPLTKMTNCLIAPDKTEYQVPPLEKSCIRCSKCSDVCPVKLLPQQLYWHARSEEHDKSKAYSLDECIECGACAYVCPSKIPLVQYFRQEKAKITKIEQQERTAEEAKQRFEARKQRLQQEQEQRSQRHKKAKQVQSQKINQTEGKDPIAEALTRIKAKQSTAQQAPSPELKSVSTHTAQTQQVSSEPKQAIVAAIARAKAKREASQATTPSDNQVTSNDTKKKSVAITRSKAKKAASQQANQAEQLGKSSETTKDIEENNIPKKENDDPKKRAVAAAIARAKVKKATQQDQ